MLQSGKRPDHAVALFLNGLGDHFITLPAIRAVSAALDGRLTLLSPPGVAEIFFSDLPLRAQVEVIRVKTATGYTFRAERVSRIVKQCDLMISFNRWFCPATAALLRFWTPRRSVGLFPEFTNPVAFQHDIHAADLAFRIALQVDNRLRWSDFVKPPILDAAAEVHAEKFYRLLPKGTKVIVVHAETAREKMWNPVHWQTLLHEFLDRYADFVAVPVGLKPLGLTKSKHHSRIIRCYGAPLVLVMAILRRADLFVGVDSCMLHAADTFSLPSVGLFGPSSAREFGFRIALRYKHLQGRRSLDSITPRMVLEALAELLDR